ncbi:MAG: 16S rRNA (uracil(1498)-N(3))-methyltransferase [Acidobacteria bacterium]|nr:16S rRNA (uracil(1498)-N(3))-methyltransferase [Acidobacteriota bacterium]
MLPRFFVPDLDPATEIVALPPDEALHLGRVLRLRPGADVRVFDGIGGEWCGVVAEVQSRRATVRIGASAAAAAELRVPMALAVATLKGDKMDDVIRDAVMMGVRSIQPIVSARAEMSTSEAARRARVGRWQRIAVASAKQCGRAVVPPVEPARDFTAWIRDQRDRADVGLMLVEPSAQTPVRRLRDIPTPSAVTLVVGPEGGWAETELTQGADAGLVSVRLGGRTLRADAVPLVALAACHALWDDS